MDSPNSLCKTRLRLNNSLTSNQRQSTPYWAPSNSSQGFNKCNSSPKQTPFCSSSNRQVDSSNSSSNSKTPWISSWAWHNQPKTHQTSTWGPFRTSSPRIMAGSAAWSETHRMICRRTWCSSSSREWVEQTDRSRIRHLRYLIKQYRINNQTFRQIKLRYSFNHWCKRSEASPSLSQCSPLLLTL